MTFREKLVQVAAVAVSIIEDLDNGQALVSEHTENILVEISDERDRQDEQWGPQHHSYMTWLMILMEEVGESAEEELKANGYYSGIMASIVHIGNQAKAWLEMEDT